MKAVRATYEVDGTAIRERRMAMGIQTADLARTAGISRSYLARLEIGTRTRMRPPTYTSLRRALDVPPDDKQLLVISESETD
ncbi:helix-turn-helix domain-containing protein [Streptomyces sp. NPDC048057]|uniref:helix-turn-helix domain-containing protein n=1 Tax=Streptomyces sp. NPDC048057 TaxID=3155628 RepID=UPI00340269B7